jgi:hypothetical protein
MSLYEKVMPSINPTLQLHQPSVPDAKISIVQSGVLVMNNVLHPRQEGCWRTYAQPENGKCQEPESSVSHSTYLTKTAGQNSNSSHVPSPRYILLYVVTRGTGACQILERVKQN